MIASLTIFARSGHFFSIFGFSFCDLFSQFANFFSWVSVLKYLGELGCKMEVYRNDELTVEELKK